MRGRSGSEKSWKMPYPTRALRRIFAIRALLDVGLKYLAVSLEMTLAFKPRSLNTVCEREKINLIPTLKVIADFGHELSRKAASSGVGGSFSIEALPSTFTRP